MSRPPAKPSRRVSRNAHSFEIGATKPVGVITDENFQVDLTNAKFKGSWSIKGKAYGLPMTSGAIENAMNKDFSLTIKATDFANWLAGLKIPCEFFFPRNSGSH